MRQPGPSPSQTAGYPKVETWVDLVALEHGILEFWEATGAFRQLREKNQGKPPWSFIDGPITANNPMGVHHAWGRTLKDAFQRFWAMNGRELRYQNGFDCQGLWVEVEVEKERGFTSKRQIEEYGIARFVEDCKARVRKFSGIQTQQSIRLGMWMDWDNSYYTMSDENNYTIWAFLKKCHGRGKICRGTDVVPWSGRSGCAYSQMEVIEGRRLVAHTAVFIKFPLRGRERESLLVWTTTPWTLSSNVAAAVNTDLEYAKIRCRRDGEVLYLALENLKHQRLKSQWEERREWVEGVPRLKTIAEILDAHGGYEVEAVMKGSDLLGLEYDGPFDHIEAQGVPGGHPIPAAGVTQSAREAHRVIDGGRDDRGNPTVVLGEGTGIVHIAPGCGDIDHQIGQREGLPQIAPLDENADFLGGFGFLTGRNATDKALTEEIIADIDRRGLLVHREEYPHVYPHCWRSGDELVFRMVEEWSIRMDWRDEIIRNVLRARWIPDYGRDREIEWLTNMRDWMISKKRYWGLALPIWVCEICDAFDVIGGIEELRERATEGWETFDGHTPHRPWIDAVKIACPECGGRMHRIPDVGSPWLDAGIVPYSTVRYTTDIEYWRKWVPADMVLECFPGQFRNWFYALLAMSTMMEDIPPFKTLVGHALVRDEHGEEMHKSKGNAIWFDDAAEQVGADAMRWLFCRHDAQTNLNFGFGPLREVRGGFVNQLWNTHAFFANYARLSGFAPRPERTPVARRPDSDRWILSELQQTIAQCRAGIEDHSIRVAALAIEEFLEVLSNWYVRQSRRRFWKSDDPDSSRVAFETLHECLETLIRLASPMIPFLTERMYQNVVRSVDANAPVSVHLTDYPQADETLVDDQLSAHMREVRRLSTLALAAREAAKIKVRQPLRRLIIGPASEIEQAAARRFEPLLREDLNVKEVEVLQPRSESPLRLGVKLNHGAAGRRLGEAAKAVAERLRDEGSRFVSVARGDGEARIEVTVDGEPRTITLTAHDLLLEQSAPEGLSVVENLETWVALDTEITEALEIEGLMRDILRRLQVERKNAGLEIEDRIVLRWNSASPKIRSVFADWGDTLAAELLCTELTLDPQLENGRSVKARGETVVVDIQKNSAR